MNEHDRVKKIKEDIEFFEKKKDETIKYCPAEFKRNFVFYCDDNLFKLNKELKTLEEKEFNIVNSYWEDDSIVKFNWFRLFAIIITVIIGIL